MTLKLVSNVVKLQPECDGLATFFRTLADDIDAGTQGNIFRMACVAQSDNQLMLYSWGKYIDPMSLMGLFETAKFHVLADEMTSCGDS